MQRLSRFIVVGAIGFIVDAAVLYAMLALSVDHFSGRLVSFLFAVVTTWLINRRYTFTPRDQSLLAEFGRYLVAMSGGAIVNFIAYSITMALLSKSWLTPALAVGIGSLAGLTVNFAAANFWVYRHDR